MIRVLIVEDDPTTGALLVQLAKRIRPDLSVVLEPDPLAALDIWQRVGADLVLIDWGLPGMLGIDLLKHIRRSGREALCAMITGNSEREAILEARAAKVDAYIIKPFDPRQVIAKLAGLLEGAAEQAASETSADSFAEFVERRLREGALGLPIEPALVDSVAQIGQLSGNERATLLRQCQVDPVLLLRVLSLANSSRYIPGSGLIETFEAGIRAIGLEALKNLVTELSLYPGHHLRDDALRTRRLELQQGAASLVRTLAQLRQRIEFDASVCRYAVLLQQVGDLALLQLIQAWIDEGGRGEDADWSSAHARYGTKVSEQIATQWIVPLPIRERISALEALPPGIARHESVVLRTAALLSRGAENDELRRLLSRFGLTLSDFDQSSVAEGPRDQAAASSDADEAPDARGA